MSGNDHASQARTVPAQVQEIQALRRWLSANEVKKRFGIGSTRLYEIWRGKPVAEQQPHASPSKPAALSLPLPSEEEEEKEPDPKLRRSTQNLLPFGETNVVAAEPRERRQHALHPTAEDFYKRLEGLESQAEQSTRMLVEVLVEVLASQRDQDVFLDELGDVAKGLATAASQQRDELEEAHQANMDLQKGWQMAETAQKWTYFPRCDICLESRRGSLEAMHAGCSQQRDSNSASARDDQGHAAAPAAPVAEQRTKPGDPFFMA
ncbi:MAG: hypothetical protein AB2556_24125 [Candidatus Thiodiazotropha sp.]